VSSIFLAPAPIGDGVAVDSTVIVGSGIGSAVAAIVAVGLCVNVAVGSDTSVAVGSGGSVAVG
jgi:hypothetical protein